MSLLTLLMHLTLTLVMFRAHSEDNTYKQPTQFCDFRFYDGSSDDNVMTMTEYSYLTEQDLLDENIKTQLYQQYNTQQGLYPLGAFSSCSCCLGYQNSNELGYSESEEFLYVASSDETQTAGTTGSPCTTNYKIDQLYELWSGPHPTTIQPFLNMNVSIIDIGDICSGHSQPNFVMSCGATPIRYNTWSNWILPPSDSDYYQPRDAVTIPLTNGHPIINEFWVCDEDAYGIMYFGVGLSPQCVRVHMHSEKKVLYVNNEIKAIQVTQFQYKPNKFAETVYTIGNIRLQKIDGSWTAWITTRHGKEYTISASKGTIRTIQGKLTEDGTLINFRVYEVLPPTASPTNDPTSNPSIEPTYSPTKNPSLQPTTFTNNPSISPTQSPTVFTPQILLSDIFSWPWYVWTIIGVAIIFITVSIGILCNVWCNSKTINIVNPKIIFIPIAKYLDENVEDLDENGINADNEQLKDLFEGTFKYSFYTKREKNEQSNELKLQHTKSCLTTRQIDSMASVESKCSVEDGAIKTNWTKDELTSFLQNKADEILEENKSARGKKIDGLFVILTCHGTEGNIITSDGEQIRKEDIHRLLAKKELREIPRIFFFDCCCGDEVQMGIKPKKNQASSGTVKTTATTTGKQGKTLTTIHIDDEKNNENIQWRKNENHPDYLLVTIHSSSIGYKSYQNKETGSYMIESFVQETKKQLSGKYTPHLYQILDPIQKVLPKKGQHPTVTYNTGTRWIKFLIKKERTNTNTDANGLPLYPSVIQTNTTNNNNSNRNVFKYSTKLGDNSPYTKSSINNKETANDYVQLNI